MEAAGAYLWALRDYWQMSREEVASAIREAIGEGTNDVQILRIEKGAHKTKADVMAAFARIVRGDPGQVAALLLDGSATAENGRAAAHAYLAQFRGQPGLQDQRRREAIALIDTLLSDPAKFGELMGYGHRLLAEKEVDRETP